MEPKAKHLMFFILAVLFCANVPVLRAQYFTPPFPSLPLPLPLPSPFSPPYSSSSSPSSSSSSSSSCVNSLSPCLRYLNSTRDPPDACCDPLRTVIKSDKQCLCNLISTKGAFQAQLLGINISQVEMLPERCGERVNPLGCLKGATRNSVQSYASTNTYSSIVMVATGAILMIIIL